MADKNVVPVGFVLAPGASKCWQGVEQVGAKMQPYMVRIACHSSSHLNGQAPSPTAKGNWQRSWHRRMPHIVK